MCLNCGGPVDAQFCPSCGQRVADPDPTLREMAEELAGEVLHWDGKLGATLKSLITSPGALTLAYVSGKRASFLSPLRLYLTASVLYFFLAAVAPENPADRSVVRFTASDSAKTKAQEQDGFVVSANRSADSAPPATIGARLERRLEQGVERAAKDPKPFFTRIRDNTPTVVFLVLPAFAFAVGLAYRAQRRHFPQHVVFAFHVHALAFLGFSLSELASFTRVAPIESMAKIIVLACIVAYIVVALRRVYGGSWPRTLAKSAMLGVVYLVFFGLGMVVLTLYSFLTA